MTTHLFYAPHPDDETIGMAGHIARAVSAGDPAIIIQVFDAQPSARQRSLFRGALRCPLHDVRHTMVLDLQHARILEQQAAADVLGAQLVRVGIAEPDGSSDGYERAYDGVLETAEDYATRYPDAVHHLVVGDGDQHAEYTGSRPAHHACWEVGCRIAAVGATVLFHRIYVYSWPRASRTAAQIETLSLTEMAAKQRAIAEYRRWSPDEGRIAFGYHSVPELFDAAGSDPREFVEPCRA